MKDYNLQNNKFVKNGLVIIERIQTDLSRLKIDRIKDSLLLRHLHFYNSELEKVKLMIVKNPRFPFVLIQEEIDRLYTIDNSLTGMNIKLDWKEGENRGLIECNLNKKDS